MNEKTLLNITYGPIEMKKVTSSQIHSVGYDSLTETLAIIFHGAVGESEYRYANVNPDTFYEMINSESSGSYFHNMIRKNPKQYPYEKLTYSDCPEQEEKVHMVKSWVGLFDSLYSGVRKFDLRVNDRDYKTGDKIHFFEYDPDKEQITGRNVERKITYIMRFGDSPVGVLNDLGLNPAPGSLSKLVILSLD